VRPSIAYRRILVPVAGAGVASVKTACSLAAEHGATVSAIAVIEVPAALPLDADMREQEAEARESLTCAEAIGDRLEARVHQRERHLPPPRTRTFAGRCARGTVLALALRASVCEAAMTRGASGVGDEDRW